MKAAILALLGLLSFSVRLSAQTRTIYGRVVYEDLEVISDVRIQTQDKLIVGKTDTDGRFKISIPQSTKSLKFSWIGMEPATIKLNNDCDTVEIVMLGASTYDFISSRKIDKERLEQFNKLPDIHLQAYKKGIFTKESVCYSREFEPWKPDFDKMEKELAEKKKQIRVAFKKLNIGDTIKIPFNATYRPDTTTSNIYSIHANKKNYDCIIKCVIVSKRKHKTDYNLVCRIESYDKGNDSSVFEGKVMKVGEVFTFNMRHFKILDE